MSAEPAYLSLTPEGIRFCPLCGARLERRAVGPDNKPEMVCTGCGFVYFLGQKVVACTIAMTAERILLTRRAIDPANGKWTFPGGYASGASQSKARQSARRTRRRALPWIYAASSACTRT